MKKAINYLLLLLILSIGIKSYAQNLVPNPSFEIYNNCPNSYGQINFATPWFQPGILGNSTDYYNQCDVGNFGVPINWFGSCMSHSGVAYSGIIGYAPSNYREYIEVLLNDTLITNTKYCLSFYVSLSDSCAYSTSKLGAYFSVFASSVSVGGDLLSNSPQIVNSQSNPLTNKVGWTEISGCFIASGGEKYLTIGNFFNDANSDTAYVGNCGNDSGGQCSIAYYFIDDINVCRYSDIAINELILEKKINIYPNPNDGNMILEYSITTKEKAELIIYDIAGKKINTFELNSANNKMTINENELSNGIYFYEINVNDKRVQGDKLVIIR